jgi:hypothetical protein
MGGVSRLRPVHFVLLAAPLLWVVLAFVHPDGENQLSEAIADQADRWIFVHAAQLVLTPFLAAGVWMLLLGIESVAASIARIALAFWMVFFSAFDAVAGLASGVLVSHATSLAGEEREHVNGAIDFMFHDSQFAAGSTISVLSALGQGTWIIVAIAATVALYRAGVSRLIVGATLGVGALHAPCRLPSRNRAGCSLYRRAAQIPNATRRGCAEPLAGASAGHDRKSRLGIRRAEARLVLPAVRVRSGRMRAEGQGSRRRHSVPRRCGGCRQGRRRPALQRQPGAANDTDR